MDAMDQRAANSKSLPKLLVDKETASQKLRERIEKGRTIRNLPIASFEQFHRSQGELINWTKSTEVFLRHLFDSVSIPDGFVGIEKKLEITSTYPWRIDEINFREIMNTLIGYLEGILDVIELIPESSRQHQNLLPENGIFIAHGHDEAAKELLARFLERLDLHPVILHEQPNTGKTIIEKFEDYSNVCFAIVLLTPDDVGSARDRNDSAKPRARQNVILELGYFHGKLGRGRVCALYKEDVEIPSDYQGVLYIPMDSTGGWKMKLAQEIKHAGIEIDLNKVL
jgi:hypothetical protein